MSVEARCKTCRYWSEVEETGYGQCRRHTPTVFYFLNADGMGNSLPRTEWPRTHGLRWCGEYEPRQLRTPESPIWYTPGVHFPSEAQS